MRRQDVVWTALPNGRLGNRLRLSVHVAPRLQTDLQLPQPPLSLFPDFANWPSIALAFDVYIGTAGPFRAVNVTTPPSATDLWTAVFKPTTFVRPHVPADYTGRKVRSYPATHIRDFIKDQYTNIVTGSPTDHPDFPAMAADGAFGQIGFVSSRTQNREATLQALLEAQLAQQEAIPFAPFDPNDPDFYAKAFLQMLRFHQPRSGDTVVSPQVPTLAGAGTAGAIDFHQMLAMAGEHPDLLRYLGIVIDLVIAPEALAFGANTVRVVPHWATRDDSVLTTNFSPLTNCVVDATQFIATPRATDPDLVDGMLAFDDQSRYQLIEIDHDGAGMKAVDFANNLQRSRLPLHKTDDTPSRYAPPSLRSGGLAVARRGLASSLVKGTFARAKQLNTDLKVKPVVLDAEDLTRGYAIDVWDSLTGKWHSLTRRVGTYNFLAKPEVVAVDDEGAVSLGPTSSATGTPPDLYQQETLFHWSGWSLAAQRPGKTVLNPNHTATVGRVESVADTDFPVEIRYRAKPGSLPRLRYGVDYRVRARAVDLAGHTVAFGDPTVIGPHATPTITYRRFEPIPTPVILLRNPRTEGESAERMVIRSNYNTPPPPTTTSERHVSPPKVHEMMVEEHGLVDAAGALDKSAFTLLGSRDMGSYVTSPQGQQDPKDYDGTRFFDVDALDLPFLPDPFARGVTFIGLPGSVGPVKVDFAPGPWPDLRPFRILLRDGTGAPNVDVPNRLLTIRMDKGETAVVRYSSFVNPADLQRLGVWGWLTPVQQASLQARAESGAIWALTPYRDLTLVHAVRQPLKTPEFVLFDGPYKVRLGQTFSAVSRGMMSFSRKSTGALHVFGSWPEAIDAGPGAPDPTLPPNHPIKSGFAYEIPVLRPPEKLEDTIGILHEDRHEFHDTKYRRVTYSATATSKFGEYFITRTEVVLTGTAPSVLTGGVVSGSVRVTAPDAVYTIDVDYTLDDALGTIARTASSKIPDGGTVLVGYIVPSITRDTNKPVTVDVPNSARPAAPKVLYIVPTWRRDEATIPRGHRARRLAGGLRVYLDRPWWSSGDGELLGVVLWQGPSQFLQLEPPNELQPYVSRWAIDPIHSTSPTSLWPTPDRFALRNDETPVGRTLDELSGHPSAETVFVAGHQVGFDTDRRLWYCDIEMDPGVSYFPFVRLALARYQPNSLDDAHLSRVVMTDFQQLTPNRSVTTVAAADDPSLINVTAVGLSYGATRTSGGSLRSGPGTMQVTLEQRSHKFAGDLGWEPAGQPIVLSHQPSQGPDTIWRGRVKLPRTDWPFRLVVEEFEMLSQDGGIFPRPGPRMVFTEIMPLTPDHFGLLNVDPTQFDFGKVLVGLVSPPKTVTVTNNGTLPLSLGSIHFAGANPGMFKISANQASGKTLAVGQSATFNISFKPTSRHVFSAHVVIPNSGVGNPGIISLTAQGVAPVMSAAPPALNFPPQKVANVSASQTLTLTNIGDADMHIGALAINIGGLVFAIAGDCSGATVVPGDSCDAKVTFKPVAVGAYGGQLLVPSDGGPTVKASLVGQGAVPIPSLPATADLGSWAVGIKSSPVIVQLANYGQVTLVVGAVSIVGPDAADFATSLDGCSGQTVAPTAAASVSVTFTPSRPGKITAKLTFPDDAPGSPQSVTLIGHGLAVV